MNEFRMPMDTDVERKARAKKYLDSLPDGTWYWTLYPQLITFVDDEDAILFRLACDVDI